MLSTIENLSSVKQRQLVLGVTLALIYILAFTIRLFSVLRFESVIDEFDPYFNYRATLYLIENGFDEFHNWFDSSSWFPLGRVVGFTVYPGLMWTAAAVYWFLDAIHLTVLPRHVCVYLAPFMASNTTLVTFLLGNEVKDAHTGVIAAALIAVVPGYISRSVAGSYDNEGVAIFALITTFYFFVKAVNTGSLFWAGLTALGYFCMSAAWGGYVFIINLIPLYVVAMLIAGRYTHRLYVAYSTTYVLGTFLSMQIRFIGFQAVQSSEHLAAFGTFGLLQVYATFNFLKHQLRPHHFVFCVWWCTLGLACATMAVALLLLSGYVSPWTGRFYALLDPTFAKEHIPIIASVSEHQPTTWASLFFDLHILTILFPTGIYYCFKSIKEGDRKGDAQMFIIIFGITAVYFAGVMVRLMLVLAPVACILGAIALASILSTHMSYLVPAKKLSWTKSNQDSKNLLPVQRELSMAIVLGAAFAIFFFMFHSAWVTAEAYSSPSIVLAAQQQDGSRFLFDDFREAYYWLRMNTETDAKIMSWWDYGYQIAAIANRTVIVDNNAWNNTHIASVGKVMSANETVAYRMMSQLGVDYVLVIFGGLTGYGSDDINKFLWMVRIGGSVDPAIREEEYFSKNGEFRIDKDAPPKVLNCLMYKLSYFRFGQMNTEQGKPSGFDRVRQMEIGNKNFELEHLEEAFTSEHWIARIYKVKKPENRW